MTTKPWFKHKLKKLLKSAAVLKAAAFLMCWYSKLAGATTRWQIINPEVMEFARQNTAVWVGWHARTVMLPFFWRRLIKKELYALTSPHQDGQIIANFLKLFGIRTISGSTNENASSSALEITRTLSRGYDVFISPDGPRGPRMRMKKSPIYFASKTARPIIFVTFSTERAWVAEKAWDKTFIAQPFGKGVLAFSEPMFVPDDISEEEVEKYRQELEDKANALSMSCDEKMERKPIAPAATDEIKQKKYQKV
ncbi:MAG: lysophospholipid acyltransferase family protein [Alphaproteobacteria bacterium]|nr:lysophospholipid acyltransferase family protein [Alphaproteobacteria bacterium]